MAGETGRDGAVTGGAGATGSSLKPSLYRLNSDLVKYRFDLSAKYSDLVRIGSGFVGAGGATGFLGSWSGTEICSIGAGLGGATGVGMLLAIAACCWFSISAY